MIPDVERERRRREFVRSPLVGQMRPSPEPPSDLERLYRKALLQIWMDSDDAARATLELVVATQDVDERDEFLLRLAEEDLLSLRLREAEQLRDHGEISKSRAMLQEILNKHSATDRYRRWVQLARQSLAALPPESGDATTEGTPHSRSP
jgi:hypothetical protein